MKALFKRTGKLTVGKSNLITSGQLYIVSTQLIPQMEIEYTLKVSYNGKVILSRKNQPKVIRKSHDNMGIITIISSKLTPGNVVDYSIVINKIKK